MRLRERRAHRPTDIDLTVPAQATSAENAASEPGSAAAGAEAAGAAAAGVAEVNAAAAGVAEVNASAAGAAEVSAAEAGAAEPGVAEPGVAELGAAVAGEAGSPSLVRVTWRRLLKIAGGMQIAAAAWLNAVVIQAAEPASILFALVVAVGIRLMRRPSRTGAILVGVVTILFAVTSAAFGGVEALAHPESPLDYSLSVVVFVAAVLAALSLTGTLRGWRSYAGATGLTAATVTAVALVVGLVAGLSVNDAQARPGDLLLRVDKAEFSAEQLAANAGRVGVTVHNSDAGRHTFTIDALDVSLELPAGHDARVEFAAAAGSYEFYCAVPGHKSAMSGTFTVR